MKIVGIVVAAIGMFLLILSLTMKVSIGDIANNMLLARQSNFVLITSVMILIGFLFIIAGILVEKISILVRTIQVEQELN